MESGRAVVVSAREPGCDARQAPGRGGNKPVPMRVCIVVTVAAIPLPTEAGPRAKTTAADRAPAIEPRRIAPD
jgi:hypothetical protein